MVFVSDFRNQYGLSPDQFKRVKALATEIAQGEVTERVGTNWRISNEEAFIEALKQYRGGKFLQESATRCASTTAIAVQSLDHYEVEVLPSTDLVFNPEIGSNIEALQFATAQSLDASLMLEDQLFQAELKAAALRGQQKGLILHQVEVQAQAQVQKEQRVEAAKKSGVIVG